MNKDLEIVIIEDESTDQKIDVDALTVPCNLYFCNTLSLAVGLSKLIYPNVYIVDLGLPDGNVIWVIEQLRNSEYCKDAVVIVVTASKDKSMHARAIAAGANEVLFNPLEKGQLVSVIESFRT